MNEDDRRDLIARQHRALYGENSSLYGQEASTTNPRTQSQDARAALGGQQRGPSPLAFDPYGIQPQQSGGDNNVVQMPARDHNNDNNNKTTSPAPLQQPFNALLSEPQQSSRTSNSSPPGNSPPLGQNNAKGGSTSGVVVAPIGTRPTGSSSSAAPGPGALNKRSTTPLTPSTLSHGTTADPKDERSTSASSNPQHAAGATAASAAAEKPVTGGLGGWGSNSGVWGSSKNSLAVQPSVWG